MDFDYFYNREAERFNFLKVPEILVDGEEFKGLSAEAIILYSMLLKRTGMSFKNNWIDKDGRVDLYNTSETRSNQKSFGLNYQKTGKELMSQDEITVMDGSKCIFQLRGVRPFLSDKYNITKHKNYRLLEDYDKKNLFDIESYMKRKGKAKLNRETVITRMQ